MQANLLLSGVTFLHGMLTSLSKEVTVAALLALRDVRSNLAQVPEMTGLNLWVTGLRAAPNSGRAALDQSRVPLLDSWPVWTQRSHCPKCWYFGLMLLEQLLEVA